MEEDVTSLARPWMFVRLKVSVLRSFLSLFHPILAEGRAPFHDMIRPT